MRPTMGAQLCGGPQCCESTELQPGEQETNDDIITPFSGSSSLPLSKLPKEFWAKAEGLTRIAAGRLSAATREDKYSRTRIDKQPFASHPGMSQPHLVLHFDVNQTMVLNDSVKKQSVADVVNNLLAEEAWGITSRGETDEASSVWKVMGELVECLLLDRPENTLTYAEWLNKQHPGKDNKKLREQRAGVFTEKGQPGESLREIFDLLCQLAMPEEDPQTRALCVLPAFYHFLVDLWSLNRVFSVVFRSFGEDLPNVVKDFNSFCEGEKEGFPDVRFNGTKEGPDLRIYAMNTGSWFRSDNDYVGIVWGSTDLEKELVGYFKETKEPPIAGEGGAGSLSDFVNKQNAKSEGGCSKISCTTGLMECCKELHWRTSRPVGMALREYFPLWHKQGRHGRYAKMLIVSRFDETRHDIFFDDNIEEEGDHAGIVDTVDVSPLVSSARRPAARSAMEPPRSPRGMDGREKRLSLPYALRYYLVKADTLRILTERDWFMHEFREKDQAFKVRGKARRCLRVVFDVLRSMHKMQKSLAPAGDTCVVDESYKTPWLEDKECIRIRNESRPSVRILRDD